MEAPIDEGNEVEVKSISAEIQGKENQSEGDTLTSSSSAEDISAKTETNEEKAAELIDSAAEIAVSAEEVPSYSKRRQFLSLRLRAKEFPQPEPELSHSFLPVSKHFRAFEYC